MISLEKTILNKNYKVMEIHVDPSIKQRFLDIGIVPEAKIKKVLENSFGGICAYFIMGSTIAIRNSDARGILVIDEEI